MDYLRLLGLVTLVGLFAAHVAAAATARAALVAIKVRPGRRRR